MVNVALTANATFPGRLPWISIRTVDFKRKQISLLLKEISLPGNFPALSSLHSHHHYLFWLKPVMRFMLFHNPHLKGKATQLPRSSGNIALLFRAGINDDNGKGFSQTPFTFLVWVLFL